MLGDQRESEPGSRPGSSLARGLSSIETLEDLVPLLAAYSRAVVFDGDHDALGGASFGLSRRDFDGSRTASVEGRVLQEVGDNSLEPALVDHQLCRLYGGIDRDVRR